MQEIRINKAELIKVINSGSRSRRLELAKRIENGAGLTFVSQILREPAEEPRYNLIRILRAISDEYFEDKCITSE